MPEITIVQGCQSWGLCLSIDCSKLFVYSESPTLQGSSSSKSVMTPSRHYVGRGLLEASCQLTLMKNCCCTPWQQVPTVKTARKLEKILSPSHTELIQAHLREITEKSITLYHISLYRQQLTLSH